MLMTDFYKKTRVFSKNILNISLKFDIMECKLIFRPVRRQIYLKFLFDSI